MDHIKPENLYGISDPFDRVPQEKTQRKVTVIFDQWDYRKRIIEFEADRFDLYNGDTDTPIYAITKYAKNSTDEVSTVFLKVSDVFAIGFSDQVKPIIDLINSTSKNDEDPNKYIL